MYTKSVKTRQYSNLFHNALLISSIITISLLPSLRFWISLSNNLHSPHETRQCIVPHCWLLPWCRHDSISISSWPYECHLIPPPLSSWVINEYKHKKKENKKGEILFKNSVFFIASPRDTNEIQRFYFMCRKRTFPSKEIYPFISYTEDFHPYH